nr:MAG TPA: Major capsid protein [Microviridae sp.]
MSDFNPLDRARINTHRSSFDLSSKKLFSAKVGEILPVYWQIAIPGNKYRISSDWFTRTVPVNTAAYTRIKEYYDFYAVPLRLISRALPQAFTQMSDYMTSAASVGTNTPQLTQVPFTTTKAISDFMSGSLTSALLDDANIPWFYGASKLLDYLNYGSFLDPTSPKKQVITSAYTGVSDMDDNLNPLLYKSSVAVNLLPLLCYQKIYFDFFSNSQWEKHQAFSYNVDYWTGNQITNISATWLQLRYANYPKDMFMGVLPASQYGSVAVLSQAYSPSIPSNLILAYNSAPSTSGVENPVGSSSITTTSSNTSGSPRSLRLNSDLSALSIRATEYLQRWKEVVQFSSKDYSDQMAAQFGIKAPEYMGNHAHYIGGWSSVININEVVNTNLDTNDSQASIAGKGIGSNSGHQITYDCGAEHCVIMCVYHAVPLLDWASTGQSPQLLCTNITDFPQPAFDQLGMQPVPAIAMCNSKNMSGSNMSNIGYNLRYWQWKSDIDRVNGALRPQLAYQAWAAPLGGENLLTRTGTWNYKSMKVFPQQLNSIFQPQVTTSAYSVSQDQLICNVNFQVYAVQNLDRNGLPY